MASRLYAKFDLGTSCDPIGQYDVSNKGLVLGLIIIIGHHEVLTKFDCPVAHYFLDRL